MQYDGMTVESYEFYTFPSEALRNAKKSRFIVTEKSAIYNASIVI